jgi:hypothetical protein
MTKTAGGSAFFKPGQNEATSRGAGEGGVGVVADIGDAVAEQGVSDLDGEGVEEYVFEEIGPEGRGTDALVVFVGGAVAADEIGQIVEHALAEDVEMGGINSAD